MAEINPLYKQDLLPPRPCKDIRTLLRDDTPDEAVDLINKLLEYMPSKRITALEALDHPFFNELKKKTRTKKSKTEKAKDVEMPMIGQKRKAEEVNMLQQPAFKRKKSETK